MIARYTRPGMAKIWSDKAKFNAMLKVELLVCEAYNKLGKISKKDLSAINKKAEFNVDSINKIEEKTHHDVVAFVKELERHIGKQAKYIHMGITSSDVLDTGLSIQLVQASDILIADVKKIINILKKKAVRYKDMVCIGRTHGVHAEPVTLGLKFALWYEEMNRNLTRLLTAKQTISVGKISGAVGTYSNIEPFIEKYVCSKLKIKSANVSTQIIQRDRHAEYIAVLAITGASLEKIALEIRHLQKTEVRELEEPFRKGQTGSSAMPHKRNPVICERICGLARLLRGYSTSAMENIALWHERDISHSSVERVIIPDATTVLDYMCTKAIEVLDGLIVYPDNMLINLTKTRGLIFSQRVLVELMNKGLVRTKAYDLVQRAAMKTWNTKKEFKHCLREDKQVRKILGDKQLDRIFSLDYYLRNVNKIFKNVGL
ncbi:MAG: adenylosuccinate lyase [Candidatus Gygaella obscura]|nr:adenylosuccinate lyase [Candidatus Gygaella obscura]